MDEGGFRVSEKEFERYEAELRGVAPAPLPEHFLARLQAAKPEMQMKERRPFRPSDEWQSWSGMLRWLGPSTALAAIGLLAFRAEMTPGISAKKQPLAIASGFKADNVQVDEDLVSSFDLVAVSPTGQPVRFHCRQWRDQLVATDSSHGVKIEQSNPRVEVVPASIETY